MKTLCLKTTVKPVIPDRPLVSVVLVIAYGFHCMHKNQELIIRLNRVAAKLSGFTGEFNRQQFMNTLLKPRKGRCYQALSYHQW